MTTYQSATSPAVAANAEAARPLRLWLTLDAVVTAGNGLIYLLLADAAGELLGIGASLLTGLGAFLLVYGAFVGVLAGRTVPPVLGTKLVIEGNLLWSVASVAALFLWLDTTAVGTFWVPAQAVVVAAFALLQISGLRKLRDNRA